MTSRDTEYRRALGLAADDEMPASLGTVGGSRGLDPDRAPAKRKKRRRAKAGRARLSQTIGSAVPGAGAELHARLAGQQNAGPSS